LHDPELFPALRHHHLDPFLTFDKLDKMKNANTVLFAAGIFAQLTAGHSIFQQASSGSTDFGSTCVRMPVSRSQNA
jgi:hypothetical protein